VRSPLSPSARRAIGAAIGAAIATLIALLVVPRLGGGSADGSDSSLASSAAPTTDATSLAAAPKATKPAGRPDGRCAFVGVVTLDGKPTAANVLLRFVEGMRAGVLESAFDAASGGERRSSARPPPSIVARGNAAEDGRFVFDGLAPGSYVVDAAIEGSGLEARGRTAVKLPIEGILVAVRLDARSARETLRGRVIFADGRPWTGRVRVIEAEVDAASLDDADPRAVWAATDDAGRFEARGLSARRVVVHAMHDDLMDDPGVFATLPAVGECVLVVPTDGPAIAGIVVAEDGGAPIAGAIVAASVSRAGTRRVTTGNDGTFAIVAPAPADAIAIEVRAAGFAPAKTPIDTPTATSRAESARTRKIRLVRSGTVRGRVTDRDGVAAAGVVVFSLRGDAWDAAPAAVTDAGGRFTLLDVAPGEVGLYPIGAGFVPDHLEGVQARGWNPFVVTVAPGAVVDATLVVARGARATGFVHDAKSAPVAGAHVIAEPVENRRYADDAPIVGRLPQQQTATAADGTFALETLVAGVEYDFTMDAPGQPYSRAVSRLANAAIPIVLDIVLPKARFIDVRVVERGTGAPIPNANVIGWGISDARGLARVGPCTPGPQALYVVAERFDCGEWGGRVEAEVGDADTTLTVELERGRPLALQALLPDGSPAAGATVEVFEAGRAMSESLASCDSEGNFLLPNVSNTYDVRVFRWTREGLVFAHARPLARSLVLTLGSFVADASARDSKRTIAVTVVDAAGVAVPRATLLFRRSESAEWAGATDVVDGRATIDRGQQALLEVLHATAESGTPLRSGVGWAYVEKDAERIEIRLPPEAPIAGTVLDADGRPVAGVLVEATPARVPEPSRFDRERATAGNARTDATGAFRIARTGPETYRLNVSPPAHSSVAGPFRADGGARDVVLRLRRGVSARITVLDADGSPVRRALVSATRGPHENGLDSGSWSLASGMEGVLPTATDGTAVLSSLDPEVAYELYAVVPERLAEVRGRSIPDWKPADTTVTLPRGLIVSGLVRDDVGKPVANAWVSVERNGRDLDSGFAKTDGTFSFDGIAPGAVNLHAKPPGDMEDPRREPKAARATVDAGATGVVLVVAPGVELVVHVAGWHRTALGPPRAELTREPTEEEPVVHREDVELDGTVRFRGLTEGARYTLWIPPADERWGAADANEERDDAQDQQFVYARALRPRSGEVVVHLEPGRPIGGLVSIPPKAECNWIHATGAGFAMTTSVGKDRRYVFHGLPDGPIHLTADGTLDHFDWTGSADTTAGSTVDLELRAK
jgi:protocatechuate 3,4-dioxygenase beta subunit